MERNLADTIVSDNLLTYWKNFYRRLVLFLTYRHSLMNVVFLYFAIGLPRGRLRYCFPCLHLQKPIDTFEIAVVYVQVEPAIDPGACIQRDKDPTMMGCYALLAHLLLHSRPSSNPTLTSVLDVY